MRPILTPNIALKVAIVQSGQKQRVIAQRSRIPEIRLSHFVTGRLEPTHMECARLAKILGRSITDLFPLTDEECAS